jgi:hypothetical protein
MRRKVTPDHLAIPHRKSNSLDLDDIGDRVSSNSSKISKFPGIDPSRCGPACPAIVRRSSRVGEKVYFTGPSTQVPPTVNH